MCAKSTKIMTDEANQDPTETVDLPVIAAELYMSDRSNFTLAELSSLSGMDESMMLHQFGQKTDILRAYYTNAFEAFAQMEGQVPDFNSYTLAEKWATMAFSLADELETVPGFARETFNPLILDSRYGKPFIDMITQRLSYYVSIDEELSMLIKPLLGKVSDTFFARIMIQLIHERLNDTSEDGERTSALIDKTTNLVQSILYTGTIDRFLDLTKYLSVNYRKNSTN